MSTHIDSYFDSKFDKKAVNFQKSFKFSMKKVSNENLPQFKRDVRIEFDIAKSDIIIETPVDKGDLLNNLKVSFNYDGQNFVVTVGDSREYTHYVNSGKPNQSSKQIANEDFITDPLVLFDSRFRQLVEEHKK